MPSPPSTAVEAGDRITYATVLRGMSTQCTGTAAAPRMHTFLLEQEAAALTALCRRKAALRIAACECQRETATSHVETFGTFHRAHLAVQATHICVRPGDLRASVKAMLGPPLPRDRRPAPQTGGRCSSTGSRPSARGSPNGAREQGVPTVNAAIGLLRRCGAGTARTTSPEAQEVPCPARLWRRPPCTEVRLVACGGRPLR